MFLCCFFIQDIKASDLSDQRDGDAAESTVIPNLRRNIEEPVSDVVKTEKTPWYKNKIFWSGIGVCTGIVATTVGITYAIIKATSGEDEHSHVLTTSPSPMLTPLITATTTAAMTVISSLSRSWSSPKSSVITTLLSPAIMAEEQCCNSDDQCYKNCLLGLQYHESTKTPECIDLKKHEKLNFIIEAVSKGADRKFAEEVWKCCSPVKRSDELSSCELVSSTDGEKWKLEFFVLFGDLPFHYHAKQTQQITILNGTLEVSLNSTVPILLKPYDNITIHPYTRHAFKSVDYSVHFLSLNFPDFPYPEDFYPDKASPDLKT